MTQQTKIPLPEGDREPTQPSLIERVVRNHDLVRMAPPPIPEELLRAPRGRGQRRTAEPVVEVQAPEVVIPEVVEQAPASVPVPIARPLQFSGVRHPVSREHLRAQGLIQPEGSVTALLEEFRIVKRQLLQHAAELARQGMGSKAQRVLICSPHSGEGKTYTALNLALAIAAEKET